MTTFTSNCDIHKTWTVILVIKMRPVSRYERKRFTRLVGREVRQVKKHKTSSSTPLEVRPPEECQTASAFNSFLFSRNGVAIEQIFCLHPLSLAHFLIQMLPQLLQLTLSITTLYSRQSNLFGIIETSRQDRFSCTRLIREPISMERPKPRHMGRIRRRTTNPNVEPYHIKHLTIDVQVKCFLNNIASWFLRKT